MHQPVYLLYQVGQTLGSANTGIGEHVGLEI